MRALSLVIASSVLIGVAYGSDRLLVEAILEAGSRPSTGTGASAVALGILGKLFVAATVGLLAWLAIGTPQAWLAGVAMVIIGLYFSLVLGLALLWTPDMALPALRDSYAGGAHLVRWAGTAVTVVGLLILLRPRIPRIDQGATTWLPAVGTVLLVGLGYLADAVLQSAYAGWSAERQTGPFVVADSFIRFATVAALLGLALLAMRARRPALLGGMLIGIGLYLAIVLELGYLLWREPPFGVDAPIGVHLLPSPGTVIEWIGTALVVIGTAAIAKVRFVQRDPVDVASAHEVAAG